MKLSAMKMPDMKMPVARLKAGFARLPDLKGAAARMAQSWTFVATGTLTLRLPRAGGLIYWWWRPAQGAPEEGTVRELSELPEAVRAGHVLAWTPGAETLFTRVTLPTRSRAKIPQATLRLEDSCSASRRPCISPTATCPMAAWRSR